MTAIPNRTEPDRPVVYRDPATLKRFDNTVRKHDKQQIAKLAASYREFGATNPILIDEDGRIIAGEGRQEMCAMIGENRFPCIVVAGLTDMQKRALRLADNRISLDAAWDNDTLKLELAALKLEDFDLKLTGFDQDELSRLLREVSPSDPNEVIEPPLTPLSQPGDVWLMDKHRILCGDATVEADVLKVLHGVKPNLMVTDPPYGVDYDPAWRQRVNEGERSHGLVVNDHEGRWLGAWKLFPGDTAYIWHADRQRFPLEEDMSDVGFELRAKIVWVKPHYVISRGDYHSQHEDCLYMVRKGGKGMRTGLTGYDVPAEARSTVWQIDNSIIVVKKEQRDATAKTSHSTQKPVLCMQRPMENNSPEGAAVYDPFVGSGTSIIAAEACGRTCHAIDISPAYVDVAVHRWQNFVRKDAIHEETGMKMHELAEARGVTLPPMVSVAVSKKPTAPRK